MAQSIKVGDKIHASVENLLKNAMKEMDKYYAPVMEVWHLATPEQKQKYLDNSPMLQALLRWSEKWRL